MQSAMPLTLSLIHIYQEEYLKNIAEIKEILKGNTQEIERMLYQQMQELAAEMKFEEAQKINCLLYTSLWSFWPMTNCKDAKQACMVRG